MGIRADENMPGHFGAMATARTLSIVPLAPETHHAPNGIVSRNNLDYQSQYRGDTDFRAWSGQEN